MLERIRAYVEKNHMLSPGDSVVAGVSGGADSVCLLFVLHELQKAIPFHILVVHIDHGIRLEAKEDAAYVKSICEELELPFFLIEKDVEEIAKQQGLSTEEAGRKVRYEAFAHILEQHAKEALEQGKAKIAIAHNSNDRAETMLFHLFRGSGLAGLCGIKAVRDNIIRPLLCVERWEIEAYLNKRGIKYCIDSTNEEDTYTRNKIRHHILPYAENNIVKGAIGHMANTADILVETQEFIEQAVEKAYMQAITTINSEKVSAQCSFFDEYHVLIRKQLILRCLEQMASTKRDITAAHINSVDGLFTEIGNREIHLPYEICVRREYDKVFFEKHQTKQEEKSQEWIICPENGYSVEVPRLGILDFTLIESSENQNIPENQYTKWFDYDKITKCLSVRNRRIGDFLTINESLSKKTIQNYMVDEKIPKRMRDSLWMLADGEHIIWVIGYRISQQYKVSKSTKRILQVQLRGGHDSWQSM